MAKYKVLSTKKLDASLVKKAKEAGIKILEQEFISVKPILDQDNFKKIMGLAKTGKLNIVFTSSNAVVALEKYMHVGDTYYVIDWNIFCLAGKTRESIENSRIIKANIIAEAANASSLAQKIIEHKVAEISFFCGNKRREELPAILKNAGIRVHEFVVYETIETPAIATNDIHGILFFSPSAVQSFFSINQISKETVCFAIGQTTADSIAEFTDNRIVVSESPSQEMMVTSVQFYFENRHCYD